MRTIILILLVIALAFAQDKPTNYFAASSAARGQQQQINSFAVWNTTSNSWVNVIAPTFSGTVSGIVAVGNGLLAYGAITAVSGRDAAGLAYYDGRVWCAPEGVGLFTYTPNVFTTQFNNTPTAKSSAFAATVVGNDVYLLGLFNQVGLIRDGVAGFAKLTWSAGGVFTVNRVGNQGYYQQQNGLPCTFCQRGSQPASGDTNKLLSYTANSNTYFVFQDNSAVLGVGAGNLWQFQLDTQNWIQITNVNGARNITGVVNDFDINGGNIYVVGKFSNLADPTAGNQYLHIAVSTNQGSSWGAVANPNPLPNANFGDLTAFQNPTTGIFLPALTGSGLTSIAVENANSIYVAGGWRITERNITLDNLAGELQTRVIRIVGSTFTLVSERWAAGTYTGGSPNFNGPNINKLVLANGVLYALGGFTNYRQVVPTLGTRFGTRYTESYKGAAQFANNQWSPAFGGYLTTSFSGDTSPATVSTSFSNGLFYFYNSAIRSTYGLVSGGVFSYGGDKKANRNNRWNSVLQNQRFVSASGYVNGIGTEGTINALHVTKKNDALIIGGSFDWIGSQRIGGIAAYNLVSDTVQQIGGGIYINNQVTDYFGDGSYNNRVGGTVNDIEEWNDRLIIGGIFNRNNSGSCVSNIAWNKFRQNGAGWEAIDGGCDNRVNDLLVVGSTLYITGAFKFCGLNPSGYNGGLYRGSIPTNGIARIDLGDNRASWRNLGIGIDGTGRAMAWRNGDLFVGGTFSNAGGRIATANIARWRKDHWEDVVAKCRGNCDRPVNVLPYIGTADVPDSSSRRPGSCVNLRTIKGRVYCIDTSTGTLSFFTSNTWYQAAALGATVQGIQNSLIGVNGTNSNYVLVSSTGTTGANGANYAAYDAPNTQYAPSHGGFSVLPNAFADGNTLVIPKLIIAIIVLIFAFIF